MARTFAQFTPIEGAPRFRRVQRVAVLPAGLDSAPTGGWVAVPADVTPATHYWDMEVLAPVRYPESPGDGWRFDFNAQAYVPDDGALWAQVRARRDALLVACDWRILPDAPTPEWDVPRWLAYRQALRDITDQADPAAIVWPVPPA